MFASSPRIVHIEAHEPLISPYDKTINAYLPMELLREVFLYSIESNQMRSSQLASVCRYWRSTLRCSRTFEPLIPLDGTTINTHLPMELLREVFLYSIESNDMKSGQLASVCRYWRSVITSIAGLWSTLRVGTWTETEQVATWLQRAYPKKVIIDPQRDSQSPSEAPMFAGLRNSLTSTGQWNELIISSFPPEDLAIQLGVQVANPMKVLKVLHVAAGCVHSPSFARLLDLVPTEAPLSELRLHALFAITHFLQPHWLPVLSNLTVLMVNGRDMDGPFELLPTFTQLQILEADRLRFPFYEPNANLPLLCTLQRLHLRACSIQWMAGRQFPCIEECAILFPRHWEVIQQHEAQLPSCRKFTYHGHPIITARYFHVPEMRAMELKSHDCDEQRVYRQRRHLCRVDGRMSKLTALHLTFQCSEQVLIKVLKYLVPLEELVLSIAYPSPSWQHFLESLAANPSTNEWPVWDQWAADYESHLQWQEWCSSQTWHANVLPHLKYLGIQCPKGFSQSECIEHSPLFRLVGWTRLHLTPPLEHLKVWEGRGCMDDIVVDYISTGYLDKHPGISRESDDLRIVRGMVTQHLIMYLSSTPFLQLHSTLLFRWLQHLVLLCGHNHEIPILPYLEQIKRLEIYSGMIPVYSLNLDLPLTRTLQWLELWHTTFPWMLGRTFKALRDVKMYGVEFPPENLTGYEGLLVDMPACTTFTLTTCSSDILRLLSCSNIQILHWYQATVWTTSNLEALKSSHDSLFHFSSLQILDINIPHYLGVESMIHFVCCGAWEQGVWRDIRSVEFRVRFHVTSELFPFFDKIVGHQQLYEKWWKEFTVTKDERAVRMIGVQSG